MTSRDGKRAIVYTRVSTARQAESGHGLDSQRAMCERYADLHGLEVVEHVEDAGVSGTVATSKRDGMGRALEALATDRADVLLVSELSRISRVAVQALGIFDAAQRGGWHVASVKESLDTTNPFGRAMAGILSVFCQLEREQTSERIRAGLAAAKRNGKRLGRPASERARIAGRRALELRESGATWSATADTLTAEGFVTPSAGRPARGSIPATPAGHSTWHPAQARRVALQAEAEGVAE